MIKDDYTNELSSVEFGFKKLIVDNTKFEENLFKEFSKLIPKPKPQCYISAHISDAERKSEYEHAKRAPEEDMLRYGSQPRIATLHHQSKYEEKVDKLIRKFYDDLSTNSVEEKYWGRSIKETETVCQLDAIAEQVVGLKKYPLSNATEDSYHQFAKSSCDNIVTAANKLTIPGLKEAVLQEIIRDKLNIYVLSSCSKKSDTDAIDKKQLAMERNARLKTYVDSVLNNELQKPSPLQATKAENLSVLLSEYGFFELPSVKSLPKEFQIKLVENISDNGVPYKIAMLDYLGFISFLKKEFFSSAYKLQEILAEWLYSNKRIIKGNIAVLGSKSKENRERYTAHLHKDEVVNYYQSLK